MLEETLIIDGRKAKVKPIRQLVNSNEGKLSYQLYYTKADGRRVHSANHASAETAHRCGELTLRRNPQIIAAYEVKVVPLDPIYLNTYEITYLD